MTLTDLTDTAVYFQMEKTCEGFPYWDYNFYARTRFDHEYMQSLSTAEIKQLRDNCKRILSATKGDM